MTRRKFTSKFKAKVALEALKESQGLNELAMKFELAPAQISKWKRELFTGAEQVFDQGKSAGKSETESADRDQLLKIIGELKVENDFLKKNLK